LSSSLAAEGDDQRRRSGKKNRKVIPSVPYSSTNQRHPLPERVRQVLCGDILPRLISSPEQFSITQTNDTQDSTNSNKHDHDEIVIVLLVGVSGGCDSMGLLRALMQIAEPLSALRTDDDNDDDILVAEWRIPCNSNSNSNSNNNNIAYEIHVVHFDHEQRGDESTADKALVQNVTKLLHLPFHCFTWSPDHTSTTLFSQDAARKWRQVRMEQLLTRLLLDGGGGSSNINTESSNTSSSSSSSNRRRRLGVVLTAHHRDDSMESLLLKILRGVHISNLQGMEQTVVRRVVSEEPDDNEGSCCHYLQARPLLSVSKHEIQEYMTSNDWKWREDASNHDPDSKYLRNRVRNQLVPLLSDMVAGSDVLQKRLDNLSRQSQQVQQHLVSEAQALLVDHAHANDNDYFVLPSNSISLDLVHKQALHMWVCDTTSSSRRRQSFNNTNTNTKANHHHAQQQPQPQQQRRQPQHQFTFEQLDRVCKQIENFPTNRQWRLNIGGGWDVMRQGNVLLLKETNVLPNQQQTEANNDDTTTTATRIVEWSLLVSDDECTTTDRTSAETATLDDASSSSSLRISVPRTLLFSDKLQQQQQPVFYLSTIDGLETVPFTPSWREGHDPIRLKDFLRGQKVPLHLRRHSRVIYFKNPKHSSTSGTTSSADVDCDDDNDKTVAVWVPTKAQWITDALFADGSNNIDDSDSFSKILLNVTNAWV
jgi:tRNA(Ile)-lysidine synthetase-like protein